MGHHMKTNRLLSIFTAAAIAVSAPLLGKAAENPKETIPSLSVTGHGEVDARPDQAVARLGAVSEANDAARAQQQVNKVMQAALAAIKALGVPENQIRTAGLTLSPIYSNPKPPNREPTEPRISGYRANNMLEVRLDDLAMVGKVIDASVTAGANQLQNLSFQLKDDTAPRQEALSRAVAEARGKADAIARAMGVKLEEALEVNEGGVHIMRPQMELARTAAAFGGADMGAPIQPGQVRVEASVNIRYRIASQQ
jgi:uncharacterized protein YggE